MSDKRIFELYCLRRSDKADPFYPELWQPFYGGKGKEKRKYAHRREALKLLKNPNATNSNSIRNYIIHKLWAQGLDYIEDTLLVELTNDEANALEKEFIAEYGRINNGTGCLSNMTDGGDGVYGIKFSEESIQRMIDSHLGEKHTEERCKKNSELRKGKPPPWYKGFMPQDIRDKISKTLTGKLVGELNPFYDHHHTEEWKQDQSKRMKQIYEDPEFKKAHSERAKLMWEDPEFRRKQKEARTGKKRSDETNRKQSITIKRTLKLKKLRKATYIK